jgi:hypothetical protein
VAFLRDHWIDIVLWLAVALFFLVAGMNIAIVMLTQSATGWRTTAQTQNGYCYKMHDVGLGNRLYEQVDCKV